LAKIAVALEQALARRARNGAASELASRVLAKGEGWEVSDVICTAGPQDRAFEERHGYVAIAIVTAGSFQYRGETRFGELMTPGSLMLGNAGQCFECGHEHGAGDRCVSFRYEPEYFERLASDAGVGNRKAHFGALRVPPLRVLTPLVAQACAGLLGTGEMAWEELSIQLAARAVQLASGTSPHTAAASSAALARISRAVRQMARHPEARLGLGPLAREAGLSPYHFLRTFQQWTGLTPHQYILRLRLREAAMRLVTERARVLDVALDSGFGDVSNFNRTFRAEFGVSPRLYRQRLSS
jgi:AraC-like DNA-binding protein